MGTGASRCFWVVKAGISTPSGATDSTAKSICTCGANVRRCDDPRRTDCSGLMSRAVMTAGPWILSLTRSLMVGASEPSRLLISTRESAWRFMPTKVSKASTSSPSSRASFHISARQKEFRQTTALNSLAGRLASGPTSSGSRSTSLALVAPLTTRSSNRSTAHSETSASIRTGFYRSKTLGRRSKLGGWSTTSFVPTRHWGICLLDSSQRKS